MTKVFVTRNWHPNAVKLLSKHFNVKVWDQPDIPSSEQIISSSQDCYAIFTEFDDKISSEIIESIPGLKVISNRAVGYENIDLRAAKKNNIKIGNTPGVLVESCADFTMGLMLDLARNITFSNRNVIDGKWVSFDQTPYLGTDVYQKHLAIIGLGQIATSVARRAVNGFNMEVSYWSRKRKPEIESELNLRYVNDINELIQNCDYLSIHCALTEDTYRIIDKEQFDLMKDVKLINTSRGPTINQNELLNAINNGNINSAALDVTDPEPPDYKSEIVGHPKILITPHLGSGSQETFNKMAQMAAENIINVFHNKNMISEVLID
tara:strand:+ start:210 stop:1175 length:966 start_codon:yes stop_codon:yes gene_type:complete